MKNLNNHPLTANNENNGFILSPFGNMYYMPSQMDPASHEGDIIKLHCKLAWSDDSEKLYWPLEMSMMHFEKITSSNGIIPLSYTKENYIFPKDIEGIQVEIKEEPGKWYLYFKNLGSIMYLPEYGIAVILGDSNKKAKSIYKAIFKMYESNCTIETERRVSVNLNDLFA